MKNIFLILFIIILNSTIYAKNYILQSKIDIEIVKNKIKANDTLYISQNLLNQINKKELLKLNAVIKIKQNNYNYITGLSKSATFYGTSIGQGGALPPSKNDSINILTTQFSNDMIQEGTATDAQDKCDSIVVDGDTLVVKWFTDIEQSIGYCHRTLLFFDCNSIGKHQITDAFLSINVLHADHDNSDCLDSMLILESTSPISDINYNFQCSDKIAYNDVPLSNDFPIIDTVPARQNIQFNSNGINYLNNSSDKKFKFLIMVCADYYSNETQYTPSELMFNNVSLNLTTSNEAPNSPTIISPSNGAVISDTNVTLSWHADDPEEDSIYCILYFGTDSSNLDSIRTVYGDSTNNFSTLIENLEKGNTYYWRVIVKDSYGDETIGPIWYFKITSNPPYMPSILSGPYEGTPGQSYTYTAKTNDPDGDSIYYMFNWDDGSFSNWIGPMASGEIVSATHTWSSIGNYSISVQAKDIHQATSDWSNPYTVFIYNDSSITIIRPNGGEEYEAGDEIEVTYKLSNLLNEVYFYLSYNSGENYIKIDSSFSNLNKTSTEENNISTYKYFLKLPDTLSNTSTNCKIKITYKYDENKSDESDDVFTINPKRKIEITKPQEGEKFEYNSICKIEWIKYGIIDSVKILYSFDNEATYNNIITTAENNYDWQVPDTNISNCYIKVEDYQDNNVYDKISHITIYHNRFQLEEPQTNTEYEIGDTITISWTYTGIIEDSLLRLILYIGSQKDTIADNVVVKENYYKWQIPSNLQTSDSCFIIAQVKNTDITDTSEMYFTIRSKRFIKLLYPAGGEYFIKDSVIDIKWDYNYEISNVSLYYKTKDTYPYKSIIKGIEGSKGSYQWIIPEINSKKCKIKIIDDNISTIFDTNEIHFTITDTPYIYVDSLRKKIYNAGDTIIVSWSNKGIIDTILISLSTDGGNSWKELYKELNNGIKKVKLPEIDSKNNKFKITHWLLPKYYGESEEFEITSGSLYVKIDSIDLKKVNIGTSDTAIIKVYNNSTISKKIDSIIIKSNTPEIFKIIEGAGKKINSNDSTDVKIEFIPSDTILYTGLIKIYGDEREYLIKIQGKGDIPTYKFTTRPIIEELTDTTLQMYWVVDNSEALDCYYYFGTNKETMDSLLIYEVKGEYRIKKEQLTSNTKYYYDIRYFYNNKYNVLSNGIDSILTLEKKEIKEVPITEKPQILYISYNTIIVGFNTDEIIEGVCKLNIGETLIEEKTDDIKSKKHIIKFENLNPSTLYNLVPGVVRNKENKYSNFTIEVKTKSSPDTTKPMILRGPYINAGATNAIVTIYATEACDATLSLYNSITQNDNTLLYQIRDSVIQIMHQFILTNLQPGETYSISILLTDLAGNNYNWPSEGTSLYKQIGLENLNKITGGNSFNTNKNADTLSPEFTITPYTMIIYDSLAIIKYQTDEQTRYKLYIYQANNPINYIESQKYEFTHKIYVTRLLPGTKYKGIITVEDLSGNETEYSKNIEFTTKLKYEPVTASTKLPLNIYKTENYNVLYWETDIAGDSRVKSDSITWSPNYIYYYNNEIDENHIIVISDVSEKQLKYIELKSNDYYDNEIYKDNIEDANVGAQSLSFVYSPEIVYNYEGKIIIYCETNIISSMNINYKEIIGGDYIPIYNNELNKIHKVIIGGLKYNSNYEFKIELSDIEGNKINKNLQIKTRDETEKDTIKPEGVKKVNVEIDSTGLINVKWEGSGAYDLLGYNVYRIEEPDTILLINGYKNEYYIDDNILNGKTIRYGIEEEDIAGNTSNIVCSEKLTNIQDRTKNLIKIISLYQNYPNPFNGKTTIKIIASKDAEVDFEVNDILGKIITNKKIHLKGRVEYKEILDLSRYPAGLYFYSIKYRNKRIVKKMLFVK